MERALGVLIARRHVNLMPCNFHDKNTFRNTFRMGIKGFICMHNMIVVCRRDGNEGKLF